MSFLITKLNDIYINTLTNSKSYYFFPISMLIYSGYYVYIHHLLKLLPMYTKLSDDRKYYIIFNISKSSMLLWITYSIILGYNRNFLSFNSIDWSNQNLYKNITALYSITDIAPLFISRKKMMRSTIIHHVCVFLAYLRIISSDLTKPGLSNGIIVYGLFSSLAFIVNFYLGFRHITTNNNLKKKIKKMAFISYILACSYNWSVQGIYLYNYISSLYIKINENKMNIGYLGLYITFLYFWINDDLILMKYLSK